MPPVLRCTEVSRANDVKGRSRRFERALATSAVHPGADISLRRTNRRFGPILLQKSFEFFDEQ